MRYCTRCFYPDTKPDLYFNEEGVCAACLSYEARQAVDWAERAKLFERIVMDVQEAGAHNDYHVIVPVSGGKDSHAQVLKCRQHGLRVLAVCARTDDLSWTGRQNLDNIARLGCDLVEVNVNNVIRRAINRYTLLTVGDISWAEHTTIFTIPIREAQIRGVPLIVWGENPQNEYGGPPGSDGPKKLDHAWLQEFGGLNGLRVSDLVERGLCELIDIPQYTYPPQPLTSEGVFLGDYFPWDGYENAMLARGYGFQFNFGGIEGQGYEYENIDNLQTGLHDYFKYIKFGFGRATDLVNNHIRRGRMDRVLGLEHILAWDGQYGKHLSYLGHSGEEVCEKIGVSWDELCETVERFTNKELFEYVGGGQVRPLFLEDLRATVDV